MKRTAQMGRERDGDKLVQAELKILRGRRGGGGGVRVEFVYDCGVEGCENEE